MLDMLNEPDTRAKLIDPRLHKDGWNEERIVRNRRIAPGRIIDEKGNRYKFKEPDYILLYGPSFPIAIVEAKEEGKSAIVGMQQAKDYAEIMDVQFAYSTNGHEVEEFSFITNTQQTVTGVSSYFSSSA
jgi:type I restriction enzyme R subunit